MKQQLYAPELTETAFMLARHGESLRNAGEMAQGRGDEAPGMPVNGLTPLGTEQVRAMPPALAAAEVAVTHVSASQLPRAQQSAEVFVAAHHHPQPTLASKPVLYIKEVSQRGWERWHTRDEVKELRAAALAAELALLQEVGLEPELALYVPWTMRLGEGESPLSAALRGIRALEAHSPQPGELIFAHAMLNRYMEAVATRVPSSYRKHMADILRYRLPLGKVSVLRMVKELDVLDFPSADNRRNRQAHGGVTQYTVDHKDNLWVPHRRIELPKPSDTQPYIEYQRGDDGMWG